MEWRLINMPFFNAFQAFFTLSNPELFKLLQRQYNSTQEVCMQYDHTRGVKTFVQKVLNSPQDEGRVVE